MEATINNLTIDIVNYGESHTVTLGNGIIYLREGQIKKIVTTATDGKRTVTFIK